MIGSSKGPKDKVLHSCSLANGSFVTCGEKHVSYWAVRKGIVRQQEVKLGSKHKRKLIMSITSLTADVSDSGAAFVCGTSDGDLLVFNGPKLQGK